ncbi:ComEC/Rec2 family competence protein [Marinilactibacillus kalidii]|uniref:ComEC/Rec2 family competence protein n=1 Tax=Marinilactibacillus kalidii TaxID=2820274 RepID=UPI001ABEB867|nr:ComEC/Rec2 family competence protein [Marinilactibacillus kalidii]
MAKRKKWTKKQKEQRLKLTITGLLVIVSFLIGLFFGDNPYDAAFFTRKWESLTNDWGTTFSSTNPNNVADSDGTVYFFDVGQGSSTLYQAADGTTVLIDTGRYDDKDKRIVSYLDRYIGTGGKIDLLIFTHNDADHIGNGDLVLDYYQVEEVWMNGVDQTTRVYENVLDAIEKSNAIYYEPKAGEMREVGPFKVEVFNPETSSKTGDHNEESIVTRTTLSNVSVVNSGDVSEKFENQIIDNYGSLQAEILLVGHHGSRDSNSKEWLSTIDPEAAVVQAGEDNPYGHPHKETLERINEQSIPLYSTIEDGTITVMIQKDGQYSITTDKP